MKQAISYIRFSSEKQSKGSSTTRQEEMIVEWLERNPDYNLSDLSATDSARSGYKGEHLKYGLGEILTAISQGKIKRGDVLLVEAVDRLGRLAPMDMFDLVRNIVRSGVAIITLQDNQKYDEDCLNNESIALFGLVGKVQQAHYYSKNLGDRIAKAYKNKRDKARKGEAIRIASPFWLNTDGSLKNEESEIVRACIDLYLNGRGPRKILMMLEEKYPKIKGTHPSTLKRWFQNRALIGEWTNQGDPIRGVFAPLVDEVTFYNLQKELNYKSKKMSPEETYGLSGLVVCAECGGRYLYRRKRHSDFVIVYANCSTYLKRGPQHCSNNKTWPYQVLNYIFEETRHTVLANVLAKRVSDRGVEELALLRDKRGELQERIAKVVKLADLVENVEELAEKLGELTSERRALDLKIIKLETGLGDGVPALTLGGNYGKEELDSLIHTDSILLRELLKRNGYRIVIDGNKALVGHQEDAARSRFEEFLYHPGLIEKRRESRYELLKRSTRHNCYIVKRDVDWHMETFKVSKDDISMAYEYAAVFRDGKVVVETHEEKLIKLLNCEKEG